ncbi:MAG: pilus assembly protein PilM [Sedimentisphaerales bacterium]|nr:pilus assembly protein PilM [Sedimentisphaerales bacterium]
MRSSAKTALGIDITARQVNMVLLAGTGDRATVLKAVAIPLPQEIAGKGGPADAADLARILKAAKKRYHLRAGQVAVSLPVGTTVTRVLPLEEDDPQRIVQLVSSELKQYASFSGRETACDFHILTPGRHGTPGRILLAASDQKTVANLIEACDRARLHAGILEPPIMACLRAVRVVTDAPSSTDNVMVVVLKDGMMTVCVLRKRMMDMVRTKALAETATEFESEYESVADEIDAALRFYQIEHGTPSQSWTVVLVDDEHALVPQAMRQGLAEKLTHVTLRLVTQTDPLCDFGPDMPENATVSLTALGLALSVLVPHERGLYANLLPAEGLTDRRLQKCTTVAAAAVAVLILFALLATDVFGFMGQRLDRSILEIRRERLDKGDHTLAIAAEELAAVNQRVTSLSSGLEYLGQIADSENEVDWARLLLDLRAAVPQLLYITNLFTKNNTEMVLQGVSHSYEDVHVFAQLLDKSAHIDEVVIVERSRDDAIDGLVRYTIRCTIGPMETR